MTAFQLNQTQTFIGQYENRGGNRHFKDNQLKFAPPPKFNPLLGIKPFGNGISKS